MSIVANVLLDWKISLLGFCLLAFTSLLNTKIAILPVSCLTFIICSVLVWFTSMCLTLVGLHKLLQKNEPLEFSLKKFNAKQTTLKKQKSELKPNPDRVKELTKDIDRYFINKWYTNISKDDDFTEESKLFLEEVINRLAEVQLSVNNKVLLHGFLNIYLKHLKEFRRSLKRKEKYNGNIEELYRYSHICSSSKPKDYFIHQLTTNLLRHFINSELWNSLPCHVLVSILARKLVLHILNLSSNPEILNYIFLNLIASSGIKEKYNLSKYTRISITQYYDVRDSKDAQKVTEDQPKQIDKPIDISTEKTDCVRNPVEGEDTVDILKVAETSEAKIEVKTEILPKKNESVQTKSPKKDHFLSVERKRSPLKKRIDVAEEPKEKPIEEHRTRTDPVKIYEPKSRNTKTWHDSKDILGISLGQDPLDALQSIPETGRPIGKSTFWDTVRAEHSSDGSPPTAANILLNEMKHTTHTTMEGLKSSIKPISDATVHTLHNIKDLQESTVNNALNKIGDFQDEAAGVVEGILDFGRAGFRKGLRLTGLQDNIENAKATLSISSNANKQQPKKKPARLARSESPEKMNSEDSLESVWINPIQTDSPNYDGQILLEKPKNSDDKSVQPKDLQIPFISMEQPEIGTDSPDPEYEDTADLATSIAKLRSLLQQRSSESSLSTPALSPMPPDEFPQKSIETENISDVEDVDGVMPSFYKFCAKTATGVFDKTINTIKTALPGNIQVEQSDNAWIFIQSDQTEADILTRMKKLLTERKEYCTLDTEIDTAYEAIDSLDTFQASGSAVFPPHLEFEDELDEFEIKLPITKTLLDIMCELLADTNSPFLQEPFVKAILLSLGNTIEGFVISKADEIIQSLCTDLITIPKSNETNTLPMEMDVYIDALLSSIPDAVKLTFGKSTLVKSLTLFVSSIQSQTINQDVVLQIFELIVMKLIEESTQISPPASA
ncbi:uncharacterized protein LOC108903275 isoform X2 [Anoplophora glabripennis]|uniref:uncharacterized protein LOC108903275 isoform X2 n=1 Tax=Anoplophora glabripennis TaxID=217634 RepID=UPI0008745CDC|nr:uncharacterized protein LOC108903275 isoform X2 [Anoplophora glabripennis]